MSVCSALSADHIKPLAEKSLLCHLLLLKELIQSGVLAEFCWLGMRVMTADGHTKVSIDRGVLLQLAQGRIDRSYVPDVLPGMKPMAVLQALMQKWLRTSSSHAPRAMCCRFRSILARARA